MQKRMTSGGTQTGFGIRELLAPISWEQFLADYREKQPLYITERDPDYYSRVFSLNEVDSVLPPVHSEAFPESRALKATQAPRATGDLYKHYLGGSTVNLNMVQRRSPGLDRLCRAFEEALHYRTWANLYLTPLHSQAFPPHYDPHDTYVLQIAGEKLWEIRPPLYNRPLGDARFDLPENLPGEPQRLRLKPGDLLYLPAGTIHEVFALDQFTLHITIGVQACTWLDLINAFLRSLAESNIDFRKSLPPRFLNDAPFQQQVLDHLSVLLRQAAESAVIPGGMSELARRTISELELCRDNRFEVLTSVEEIHRSTPLRKRTGMICFAEKNGDRVILYFRGGVFSGPAKIMPAIEHIISKDIFTPQTLPGLSDASRLVLSKRLVKDGLLTLAGS